MYSTLYVPPLPAYTWAHQSSANVTLQAHENVSAHDVYDYYNYIAAHIVVVIVICITHIRAYVTAMWRSAWTDRALRPRALGCCVAIETGRNCGMAVRTTHDDDDDDCDYGPDDVIIILVVNMPTSK